MSDFPMFFTLQAVFQLSKKVGDDAPREHAIQTEHKESRGSWRLSFHF